VWGVPTRRTYYLLGLLPAIVILLAIHGVFSIYETGRSNAAESEMVLSALAFSYLVDAISKKEFYGFGYEGFIYNITVIQSNNMSVEVSRDGFLSIYLENKGDKRRYEDFEWIIHGYKLENFPERFRGFIEPRSRIEIYRAYLPMILTKPGVFEVIITSSEELTFNVVLSSQSDEAKVKELMKLAPILKAEYNAAKPQELTVRLPRYSLFMVIEVKPNPEELRPYQVIDKPWFIDVEVEKGIEVILQRIDNPKVREGFMQRWGSKNVTVITVYINNRSNKTLSILDWGSYDIYVLDPYKGGLVGYCGVKALVMKPFKIDVEPGQREPLIDFIVEYVNENLYINGGSCGPKLEPGKYIFKIELSTDPSITITMVMNLESER